MIRVLHIFGGLGTGGTESLIMNWYRNIDRSVIQFDFLVRSKDKNYVQEIEELGGRIFYTSSFPKHFFDNYRETKKILERKEWDVIHVHANAAIYMLPLKLSRKLGYSCRIMHSHSVHAQNSALFPLHAYNRNRISKYTTCRLACSEAAGKWMYGEHCFTVIHNAVATDKFVFDSSVRCAIRKEYGIEDKIVIGHVGRFSNPKNHVFLLDIFEEIKKQQKDSVLMLVGDGELRTTIEQKTKDLGLSDSVLFMGRRNDVGRLMSAMDIFVLPSLYEGLPVVCVESCANGLCAIISEEAYTKETEDLPNVRALSLGKTAKEWADYILQNCNNTIRLPGAIRQSDADRYDITRVVSELQDIYLNVQEEGHRWPPKYQ